MINHPATLDPQLQIEIWLTDLRNEYVPNEIFDSLSENYVNPTAEAPQTLPNAAYLKLQSEANDAREVTVGMYKELSGPPTLGANGDQRTREEDILTKWFKMQDTDISHATTNQAYGRYARDKFPWKLFEKRVPLLDDAIKRLDGSDHLLSVMFVLPLFLAQLAVAIGMRHDLSP
jgi:hypothetical protein